MKLTSSTRGPSPSSILWASSAFFCWGNTNRGSTLPSRLHLCHHHGNTVGTLTWSARLHRLHLWMDERLDVWMDGERWMQLTIIRAFNSSWAHSFLPQLPLSSSRKKRKITHLPWAERGREKEQAGRRASGSGREKWVGEEEQKKKRRRGLKGFGAYLMMKDREDLTSSLLPATIGLKTRNPGREW